MPTSRIATSLLLAACCAPTAWAQDEPAIPTVRISAKLLESYPYRMAPSSDSATMLANTPGYAVAGGGAVSGLPFVNGLGDDRLKIRIGELEVTSACANHMNPPMSYIDPRQIQSIELLAGITPVSNGGDSIGGTINIHTAVPVFARAGAPLRTEGSVSLTTRSVSHARAAGVSAALASENLSLAVDAAHSTARSYRDGDSRTVLASMAESANQSITLGARRGDQRLILRAGRQHIPYQGFPNQYMDMTDNTGHHATLSYHGQAAWGEVDATAYWQRTTHTMGFFSAERPGTMPMESAGRNLGATSRLTLPLGQHQLLRAGYEVHTFRLNDYWPAVPGSMMMGPQTYINIADGRRDRAALFAELVTHHGERWISQFGARREAVRTDAGEVQAYSTSMMNLADAIAAAAFNARARSRHDVNLDLTASARFEPSATFDLEFGYGRKSRSPNLYERYTWGRGVMAMTMTNWFGDGNGYVGDIALRPETANTVSLAAHWHDADKRWFVKLAPYYNRVSDYIDVDTVGAFNPYRVPTASGALLRFANHDATLYGVNLSWQAPLPPSAALGQLSFTGHASLTRGSRDDGGDLYRMMPPTARFAIEQRAGAWSSGLDLKVTARKDRVDARRHERVTPGHALLNARAAWEWRQGLLLTVGVSNVLDKAYDDPLGGVNLTGLRADQTVLRSLRGPGRSFDAGLSYRF